jgi:hypothetical protein
MKDIDTLSPGFNAEHFCEIIVITAAFMFEKVCFDPPESGIYARSPV